MFPSPTMTGYRQPPNLRRILCKGKLYHVNRVNRLQRGAHTNAPRWKTCGKPCKVCPFTIEQNDTDTGTASGYTHNISEPVSTIGSA
jgi:hypothetical protein